MANTKSAKKNIRSSANKKSNNDMWENRIKTAKKSLSRAILSKEDKKLVSDKMIVLQKSLDKAVKETGGIHDFKTLTADCYSPNCPLAVGTFTKFKISSQYYALFLIGFRNYLE